MCDDRACEWYEKEATEDIWSVRTLQRNVDSQYYYRIVSCSHEASKEDFGIDDECQ
ncbi:MAG: hypothetical protein IJT54_02620 [Candidatus Methanomethylophilaceae archaeon]|nr:hypothetical protein [Candidatus Methanomethylophilaceae archaeon]